MQNKKDIKPKEPKLEQLLAEGVVVERRWLYDQGFKRSTVDYFLRSGKLVKVGRGAYRRPGPPLKWQHLYYSLQILGYNLHVGGKTALNLQGFSHYLPLGGNKEVIELYGKEKPPKWLFEYEGNFEFLYRKEKDFDTLPPESLTNIAFGHWDWQLRISTAELALMELVAYVEEEADFYLVDRYFESVTVLRADLLFTLLQKCKHIRTRRLFLWFANRHHHRWFDKIEKEKIPLGSGKRVIVKNGTLDKSYQITVPREMAENDVAFF